MAFQSEFIKLIQSKSFENVFNPYVDVCETYDVSKAQEIRLNNLRSYLTLLEKMQPNILWVGEALGHRGGRRTGLPFTDEKHLNTLSTIYKIPKLQLACNTKTSEMTATQVWKFVSELPGNNLPFLWNIFPYHPFKSNNQFSNRQLITNEISEVRDIIELLIDNFSFKTILSIGKKSYNTLKQMNITSTYIRHPSHGGANIFRNQLKNIYL